MRTYRSPLVWGLFLVLALTSCRKKTAPKAEKVVQKAKAVATGERQKTRPVRKRLLPPLRPRTGISRESREEQEQSCALLVNKVCALYSQGAEECRQARRRLRRRPGSLHQEQCSSALRWYRIQVEDSQFVQPCRLVVKEKCRAYGKDSPGCASAKSDTGSAGLGLDRACKAELLMFKGFP